MIAMSTSTKRFRLTEDITQKNKKSLKGASRKTTMDSALGGKRTGEFQSTLSRSRGSVYFCSTKNLNPREMKTDKTKTRVGRSGRGNRLELLKWMINVK